MAKKLYQKGRKINDLIGKTENKNPRIPETLAKPKVQIQKMDLIGSGKFEVKGGDNFSKPEETLPDINALEKEVLKYIIGQDKQVRQIITAIYRAKLFNSIKSNVLIIGNSGTGKTATIVEVAKRLNLPYTIEDATKYTKEGYYGADVNEMVSNLLDNAEYDLERAQNGIIIIDEIDKKAGHDQHDVGGVEVLKSLLKIIEGTKMQVPIVDDPFVGDDVVEFDTKNVIVIFLGAFSGLEKIREKRLNLNTLGFSDNQIGKSKEPPKYTKKDLVTYGMPEEFVGRIDTIIEMNKLTKEDLALILKNSKLSIFRKYQAELRKRGIRLEYDEKLFELIAEKSLALDTGARELSNTVNRIFENISYNIFSNKKNYTKCKLSLDIVEDNTKYELS